MFLAFRVRQLMEILGSFLELSMRISLEIFCELFVWGLWLSVIPSLLLGTGIFHGESGFNRCPCSQGDEPSQANQLVLDVFRTF